jgi:hypothetical protein
MARRAKPSQLIPENTVANALTIVVAIIASSPASPSGR